MCKNILKYFKSTHDILNMEEIKPCTCGCIPLVQKDSRYLKIYCLKNCKYVRQDLLAPLAEEYATKYWNSHYSKTK